jgi:hypothetical protein
MNRILANFLATIRFISVPTSTCTVLLLFLLFLCRVYLFRTQMNRIRANLLATIRFISVLTSSYKYLYSVPIVPMQSLSFPSEFKIQCSN